MMQDELEIVLNFTRFSLPVGTMPK